MDNGAMVRVSGRDGGGGPSRTTELSILPFKRC